VALNLGGPVIGCQLPDPSPGLCCGNRWAISLPYVTLGHGRIPWTTETRIYTEIYEFMHRIELCLLSLSVGRSVLPPVQPA
jgi:hypothetical protein